MKIDKKLGFLVGLAGCMGLCLQAQGLIGGKQKVAGWLDKAPTAIQNWVTTNFPKNLKITVDKGSLTINQKLPYCVPLETTNGVKSGIVFDVAANPNIASFETKPKNFPCNPMVLVGPTYVAYKDNQSIRINQIPKEVTTNVDRQMILDLVAKYAPAAKNVGIKIYTWLPLMLLLVVLPGAMVINFWYSTVLGMVAKIFKLGGHPELKNRYWITLFFGGCLTLLDILTLTAFHWKLNFPLRASLILATAGVIYLKSRPNTIPKEEEKEN